MPGPAILSVSTSLPGSYLKPKSLVIEEVQEVTAGSGDYIGKLKIELDETNLVRSRKGLVVPIQFKVKVTDPAAAQGLVACSSSSLNFLNDPVQKILTVPRNSTTSLSSLPYEFSFCFLSSVRSGGDDGGGSDRCEVTLNTATRVWTLSGRRGDDAATSCAMYCLPR